MTGAAPAGCPEGELAPLPPGVRLDEHLALLRQENASLGQELLRCYEQLALVFDLTENIAPLHDPGAMQSTLLRRVAEMLRAGALFVQQGDLCAPVDIPEGLGIPVNVPVARLCSSLAREIAQVRQTRRARAPRYDESLRLGLRGAHVLLASLRQLDAESAIVIVLRHPQETPFDSGDLLATESVLGYGGHILANVQMVRHLQQTAVETVRALANAIDAKDNYTCGHSERVGWLARLTGTALALPEPELQVLEWAGILHDVGKIGISDDILKKPGRLTASEFVEMKRHSRLSFEVLRPVARLGPALDAVLYHHENWDGTGYPEGRAGEEIPLLARIIRVVDMFDALTSTRSYRQGFPLSRALHTLEEEAGRGLDPHVAATFVEAFMRYRREESADFARRFSHVVVAPSATAPRRTGRKPTRTAAGKEAR